MTKIDHLFHKNGSPNWYIRLQQSGKDMIKSLGTPNRDEAIILSLPLIAQHKAALLAARPHLETLWQHKLEPGREHVGPDGGKILATDKELFYIGPDGAIVRTEPNGGLAVHLAGLESRLGLPPIAAGNLFEFDMSRERPKVPTRNGNGDDALFQNYLDHGGKSKTGVQGSSRREAEGVWSLFRRLTDGKPLKDCDRDDGRKLVAHFEAAGLKSASIHKKIMWLTSAVNHAIREGKLKFNPFAAIVPKRDDAQKRLPLDHMDIAEAKSHLDMLKPSDQLLFRLLACTGARLGEAFQVDGESCEQGIRFVIAGTKTEQSLRRIPLPADILPHLPVIKGKLFAGTANDASKRLNTFLRDIGIADPCKTLHSLRHRAGCPIDVRWALLGHETKSIAEGYGAGHPMTTLRPWIDRVGF
jgi:integrase